jgi:hypothetical protein
VFFLGREVMTDDGREAGIGGYEEASIWFVIL